jgi:hypothetical protein
MQMDRVDSDQVIMRASRHRQLIGTNDTHMEMPRLRHTLLRDDATRHSSAVKADKRRLASPRHTLSSWLSS